MWHNEWYELVDRLRGDDGFDKCSSARRREILSAVGN